MGEPSGEQLVGAGGLPPDDTHNPAVRRAQVSRERLVEMPISLQHAQGTLQGRVFLAPGGPWPAVLVNCGCYSGLADTIAKEAPFYATRGYAYVLVWNTGSREDIADHVFQRWPADAAAVLDWLGQQPWCDGRVGTHGVSLLGSTAYAAVQVSLAQDRPEHRAKICAVAPAISFSRIQPTVYLWGNSLAAELVLRFLWLAEVGVREGEGALSGLAKTKGMFYFFALKNFPGLWDIVGKLPIENADEEMWGRMNKIWRGGLENRLATDPFWSDGYDAFCNLPAFGDRCPPIQLVTGWWDIFLLQTLNDFADATKARQNQGGVRLMIFAGGHFGAGTRREISLDTLEWYDTHLLGIEHARPLPGPVYVEVIGGKQGEFLEYPTWPPATDMWLTLFACAPTVELGRLGSLVRHQPGKTCKTCNPLRYMYDPSDPTPYAGGGWLNFRRDGSTEQRSIELRSDVIVLTSEPMACAMTFVGVVRAILFMRSSVPECDVVARLCVVRKPHGLDYFDVSGPMAGLCPGNSMNLCENLVRVKFELGIVTRLELEVGPTCFQVNPGDRIRLQVCSAAHPKALRHPLQATGDWLGSCALGEPALMELFAEKDKFSCLQLPIAPCSTDAAHEHVEDSARIDKVIFQMDSGTGDSDNSLDVSESHVEAARTDESSLLRDTHLEHTKLDAGEVVESRSESQT